MIDSTMRNSQMPGPIPKYPTHPGVLVKQELEAKNQSISDFIGKMEKYGFVLAKLINKKADIDKDIAKILEKELGISADYWIRLQDQYDKDMDNKSIKAGGD